MFNDISIRDGLKYFAIAVVMLFSILGGIAYLALGSMAGEREQIVAQASLLRHSNNLRLTLEALRADRLALGTVDAGRDAAKIAEIRQQHARRLEALSTDIVTLQRASLPAGDQIALEAARVAVAASAAASQAFMSNASSDASSNLKQIIALDAIFLQATEKIDALTRTFEATTQAQAATASAALKQSIARVVAIGLSGLLLISISGWWLHRHFAGRINQLVVASQIFGSGESDLTRRLPTMSGAFGTICAAINGFVGQLHELVSRVAHNAADITLVARQISVGSSDLSVRTEQQASTIEETASSMEEFTQSVRLNADNARRASTLAASALIAAQTGGKGVGEAVAMIKAANESSRKIGSIVATIDSIAFQTNILALNAAVEAARAGEQGRGFAVVAAEVRALAQRSAASAKEIKSLIGAAIDQVESGAKRADDAGNTMHDIVIAIQQATEVIREIDVATAEQSISIEQVNRAIVQMENVTQQNAALVEQTAAAVESMREQAEELSVQVARFRLDQRAQPKARVAAPRGFSLVEK